MLVRAIAPEQLVRYWRLCSGSQGKPCESGVLMTKPQKPLGTCYWHADPLPHLLDGCHRSTREELPDPGIDVVYAVLDERKHDQGPFGLSSRRKSRLCAQ